jgi:hypothetical protein
MGRQWPQPAAAAPAEMDGAAVAVAAVVLMQPHTLLQEARKLELKL